MNALKSYSSDEDSDAYNMPAKPVKDGDPGTNYDSVGMDISEDSDEEKSTSVSTKTDRFKNVQLKTSDTSSHSRENIGKNSSRDSRDKRESSSGSSRDSRDNNRDHSSRDTRRTDERDRRHDRDNRYRDRHDRGHHDYEKRHGNHHRYGRERSHRSRSSERHRRSHSRSPNRRNINDVRRDAQLKLAAMKAANPNFDQSDLLRQSMVEQIAEVEKQTGITIPTYYNPAMMNPLKLADQERKKRLLWGNKNKQPSVEEPAATPSTSCMASLPASMKGALWANTTFNNDNDGKMAEKFKRLMGVKLGQVASPTEEGRKERDALKKQESLFVSMEKQYETARMVTHTNKGFGLGFSSQPFIPKQ